MKNLYSNPPVPYRVAVFRNGPETSSEHPDPLDAVRAGVVGDLADLQQDVEQEAERGSTLSSALNAWAQGPIVGPVRLWRRIRSNDRDDNE